MYNSYLAKQVSCHRCASLGSSRLQESVPPVWEMSITAVSFRDLSNGESGVLRSFLYGDDTNMWAEKREVSYHGEPPEDKLISRELRRQEYDGMFVLDSFGMVSGPRSWEVYMAEILFEVYQATGMKCLAVVMAKASLPEGSYLRMLEVIQRNFQQPRFMVWVAMGPDFDIGMCPEWLLYQNATQLLDRAARFAPEQRMVFGGSSGIWQHRGRVSEAKCISYDLMCIKVKEHVRMQTKYSCITGGNIFAGMSLMPNVIGMGRVTDESMPVLIDAFKILSKWGMARSPAPWYRRLLSRL